MSREQVEEVIGSFGRMSAAWQAGVSVETIRRDVEVLYGSYPADGKYTARDLPGAPVPSLVVTAEGAQAGTILHLHGGGYSCCSPKSHTPLAARLSQASGARVVLPDYRMVPEYTFPAAHDDALAMYRWLLETGTAPNRIAITGNSSGGGMALSLLQRIVRENLPKPACGVLMSPWADLACTGQSYVDNAQRDPISSRDMARGMAMAYLGADADLSDPFVSPIHGNFKGLPPLLVDVGDHEIYLDDSRTIAAAARAAQVTVTFREWPGMIHVWHLFASKIDEGREAIAGIGEFLKSHLR